MKTTILTGSAVYRGISRFAAFLDRQWESSRVGQLLTSSPTQETSLAAQGAGALRRGYGRLFHFCKLDRVFAGSVLTHLWFWTALAVGAAPLVPTMAALGLCLPAYAALFIALGQPERRLSASPVNKWVWGYALALVVCTLSSLGGREAWQGGALTLAFTLFFFVTENALETRQQVWRVIWVMLFAGFLVSLYGYYQVLSGATNAGNWVDKENFSSLTLRVYATLDNPNVLSEYLLLVIPLGVAALLRAKSLNGRLAAGIATAAMLLTLVLTYSRGGWLGLLLGAAVFLCVMDRRFIALGLAALPVVFVVMPDSVLSRFVSISNLADTSTAYRLNIWRGSLRMLRDHWLGGIGFGLPAYAQVYPAYALEAIVAPHAHSLYLELFLELGLGGFLVFLGALGAWVRSVATAIKRGEDRLLCAALLAGLVAFLFQSGTDHSFYNYRVMLFFWCYLGLGAAVARGVRDD